MKPEEVKGVFAVAQEELQKYRQANSSEAAKNHRDRAIAKLYELLGFYKVDSPNSYKEDSMYDQFVKLIFELPDKYDGESPLENYFNFIWNRRKKGAYKKSDVKIESLDEPLSSDDGDEDLTRGDFVVDESPGGSNRYADTETMSDVSLLLLEVGGLLSDFAARAVMKNGMVDRRKEAEMLWQGLLYTEMVTDIIKNVLDSVDDLSHEAQTFKWMSASFLDHYMSDKCRNYVTLWSTPLKCNGDFGLSDPEEKLAVPLDTRVWLAYLLTSPRMKISNEASARSSLTQYRKRYHDMINNNLEY